ncbi:sphingomyelin phosphodiesterase [Staphylococcus simulans]|nr:sphingomyelin phosphodiesterase [Staphylococcus simulans]
MKKKIISIVILTIGVMLGYGNYMQAQNHTYPNDLKLTTHNVYFMPRALYPNWGQVQRAQLIPKADYMQNQDVVILNELFDETASQELRNQLKGQYPYQTPTVGKDQSEAWHQTSGNYVSARLTSGGVGLVSKWPIERQEQHIYTTKGCGADALANKGFAYIKINKNGHPYHIIGTHLQAEDSTCSKGKDKEARANQMKEIQQFIKEKQISENEAVFIGGDLNVIKGTEEYQAMFQNLNAAQPTSYQGAQYSWDTSTNGIANYNYPKLSPQHLDYILPEKNHAQPDTWNQKVHQEKSPKWTVKSWGKTYEYNDYSDHYPVSASSD